MNKTQEALRMERVLKLAQNYISRLARNLQMDSASEAAKLLETIDEALALDTVPLAAVPEAHKQPAQDDPDLQDKDPELVEQHYKQVVDGVRKVFDAKRKQQPAPVAKPHEQQEPAAWLIDNDYTTVFRDIAEIHRNKGAKVEPLYKSPPNVPTARASKPLPEDYTALEQALTRLQKSYADLEGRAELVRADEREACAKIVEGGSLPDTYSEPALLEIANEIRARGQA